MGLNITMKSKQALAAKTSKAKRSNKHKVSLSSISAVSDQLPVAMQLEQRTISSLKGMERRARKTSPGQLEKVCKSIAKLKQCAPVLIDQSGEIINGHIVVEALKSLGEEMVWCAVIDHLDKDERALLHVALNRIGETGDWDIDALGPLLIELDDLGFELETTGFSLPELDIVMNPVAEEDLSSDSSLPKVPDEPISQLGDFWQLGEHRLLCGDATDPESYKRLLLGGVAQIIFTDCPWNIPIEGFVSGLGKVKHADFKQGAGEMSSVEFAAFCETFHELSAAHLADGGVLFSCIDWRSGCCQTKCT